MNRVAVVTGAARGIGAATVRGLAAAGWAVVAVDRGGNDPRVPYAMGSADELHAVVESARALAPPSGATGAPDTTPVIARVADATDPDALTGAVATAEEQFGGLDAMISVAGVIAGGVPLWEMPGDQVDAVLGVDLGGPITAARVGVPALLRRAAPRQGRYLAVASAAATRGLPMLSAYGAAKAGVAGLVRGLAVELAGTGVTANAISPGSTATAMLGESARLYGLDRHRLLCRPAAHRAPPHPRGGGGDTGMAGRDRERPDHRGGDPGGRRPLAVTPLPEGFGLVLDRSVRSFRHGTVLVGGHPGRLITLSPAGVRGLASLLAGESPSVAARQLGARLVDAGMAHPRPRAADGPGRSPSITVVVPARDRSDALDRCLRSLGSGVPVVVVDDASRDSGAIAAVCREHGARVIRRAANGGPAAARNQALAGPRHRVGGLRGQRLHGHRGVDRALGLAVRRPGYRRRRTPGPSRALGGGTSILGSSPDTRMPARPSTWVPTRVRWAPTGWCATSPPRRCWCVGRRWPPGSIRTLRVGEDVDLVWRMLEAGWRVRYHPSVTVWHREPSSWGELLARRFRYGTSAARTVGASPRPAGPGRAATVADGGRRGRTGRPPPGRRGCWWWRRRRPSSPRFVTMASRRRSPSAGARRPPGGRRSGWGGRRPRWPGRSSPSACSGGAPAAERWPRRWSWSRRWSTGGDGARARSGPLGGGVHRRRRGLRSRGVGGVPANAVVRTPDAGASARTG